MAGSGWFDPVTRQRPVGCDQHLWNSEIPWSLLTMIGLLIIRQTPPCPPGLNAGQGGDS